MSLTSTAYSSKHNILTQSVPTAHPNVKTLHCCKCVDLSWAYSHHQKLSSNFLTFSVKFLIGIVVSSPEDLLFYLTYLVKVRKVWGFFFKDNFLPSMISQRWSRALLWLSSPISPANIFPFTTSCQWPQDKQCQIPVLHGYTDRDAKGVEPGSGTDLISVMEKWTQTVIFWPRSGLTCETGFLHALPCP